jgi:hypothetical protein
MAGIEVIYGIINIGFPLSRLQSLMSIQPADIRNQHEAFDMTPFSGGLVNHFIAGWLYWPTSIM